MKRYLVCLSCLGSFGVASCDSSLDPRGAEVRARVVVEPSIRSFPHRFIVQFRTPPAEMSAKVGEVTQAVGGIRGREWRVLNGFEIAGLTAEGLQRLKAHPAVLSVEPDGDDVVSTAQSLSSPANLWGLDRIDQRSGTADDLLFNHFFSGLGVRIYVLDSGIYPHPNFGSRLATGYSAIAAPNPYEDSWGHGTMVASIAAGAVTGVAKQATLVSVRVVRVEIQNGQPIGLASHSDQIEGLDWIQSQGAQPRAVVNYSISPPPGSTFSSGVRAALNNLSEMGFAVVVGAGNWDEDACIQGRDLLYPSVLVVGASNFSNHRASYPSWASNYGPCVDLFAPGAYVATETSPGAFVEQNPSWGTSIAAPFVSGVAATMFQQRPMALPWEIPYIIRNGATSDMLDPATLGSGSLNRFLNSPHRWVWISGPTMVYSTPGNRTATWTAQPIGGDGTWTYQWTASVNGGPWTVVGTGSSYSRTVALFSNYELRLNLTGTSFGEVTPSMPPAVITVTCGGC